MAKVQMHTSDAYHFLFAGGPPALADSLVARFHNSGITTIDHHTAASFAEFERLLLQQAWDVIICRYGQPPFAVADLLRLARRLQPQAPVIVVGEQVASQDAFELGRLGAQAFVDTADGERLFEAVQQVLSAGQAASPMHDRTHLAANGSPVAQLAQILDAMQDAIMAVSLTDRRVIYMSASCEQVFGYSVQRFIDDPQFFKQVVPPGEVEQVAAARETALRDGFVEFDHRITFPDGTVHWLHRRAYVLYSPDGRPVQVIDTAHDITASKNAEALLRRSEAYLRSLVDSQTAFNLRVDTQGKITYCNERYRRQFAWVAPSLIGITAVEFVHPEDQHKVYAAVAECLADAGTIARIEIRKRLENGDYIWTRWEFSAVCGSEGVVQEIHCVGFDITQQKEAEAALLAANRQLEQRVQDRTAELQEERNLLRTVIDAIPDPIYVRDRRHRMVLDNLAHSRAAGATNGAAMDAPAVQFHADEEWLFATDAPIVHREEHSLRPDGGDTWMHTTMVPLRNVQGETVGLVTITRDITARKQAEAAMEAALAREKELGELKSRFVSMASHEFRNPLAAILTTAETLALLWEGMDKAKIEDRLHRIRDQVLRLSAITEDMLQLTRLQTGRTKSEPTPGDLDELCSRVVRDLAELPGNGDRIRYDCVPHPLPAVFDARLLQQAIGNLLHNALKYSPPDKVVHIALAEEGGQITLRIVDEGIGIPAEDLPHLFEPFHRAANVGAIHGTGLGLAIAKEAIELHGGVIAVESQVGVGTTFIVSLPGAGG